MSGAGGLILSGLLLFVCWGGAALLSYFAWSLWHDQNPIGGEVPLAAFFAGGALCFFLLPIGLALSKPDARPCVREAYTSQYNAATKTTMLVRYCAQYGEWVTEPSDGGK